MTGDLNSNKKEQIIKDLLYEQSAKELLMNQEVNERSNLTSWLMRIAAIGGIIVLALIGNNLLNQNTTNQLARAKSDYEFPIITKSRSAETNVIDQFIQEINQKIILQFFQSCKVKT